jgi:crossover junction endonuclease MUS81
MFIKVDSREKDLQNKLSYYIASIPAFRNLKIVVENLPIGDVIISNNNDDELIIERKSVNDLLSSIKDGRYEEQSYRLNGLSLHNHNIMYMIEGDINKMNTFRDVKFEKLTMYSAIFSLNYYKGFSVIRTFNIDETALFICNCTTKLMKGVTTNRKAFYLNKIISTVIQKEISECELELDPKTEIKNENNTEIKNDITVEKTTENPDKDYIDVVKRVKKENITTENIDEIMLCQIPGVSTTTAVSIIKKYNSIAKLIKALEENEKCLNDVTNINGKGQSRKITKTSITNIMKFLLKK